RGDLADEDVAGLHLRTDADDAVVVEVLESLFTNIRDVAGDFLGSELRVAGGDLEFLDVNRGEDVLLEHFLGDEDRVFEVVAVPRHKRDEHVAAECHLALLGRGTVGNDVAELHLLALLDDGLLVEAGAGVRAHELAQLVNTDATLRVGARALVEVARAFTVGGDDDPAGVDGCDDTGFLGDHDDLRVTRDALLDAGTDVRRLGLEKRHALALHVRYHERSIGVFVRVERVHVVEIRRSTSTVI